MRPQHFFNVRLNIFPALRPHLPTAVLHSGFGLKFGTFPELPRTLHTQQLHTNLN